jgi:hypothetical protein
MNETHMMALALLDFVPNLAFLVGAIYLVRLAWRGPLIGKVGMAVGAALVLVGGTTKALWKLLYTMELGDSRLLSEMQFVLLAPGFVAMMVGAIYLQRAGKATPKASLPAMATWKIPFLAVMTLGSLALHGVLSFIAFRRRARLAGVLFIVAVLCMLSLAGMASGEQTVSRQWIEESVNSAGQIAFALGSHLLYRRARGGMLGAQTA